MSLSLFTRYCVDTSSLIDLNWRRYPQTTYPDLFKRIDAAFACDTLVAPREVKRELQNGSHGDDLQTWVSNNAHYFVDPDEVQVALATQLLAQMPTVCDIRKQRPIDADPWVIVLAQAHGLTVVSSESLASDKKIPHFCRKLGIPVLGIEGFFEAEGWSFNLGGEAATPPVAVL